MTDDADIWWARYHARSVRVEDAEAVRVAGYFAPNPLRDRLVLHAQARRDKAAVKAVVHTLLALGYGGEP